MTHPLEEVAAHLDEHAACIHPSDRTHHHIRDLASILRAAIPDCECGELVRETLASLPPNKEYETHFSVELDTYNGVTNICYVKEAPSAPYEETDRTYTIIGSGPTLPAAVAAARANGAEGTPNGSK